MVWYYYIAWVAILSQVVFLVQMYRNYHYAVTKYKRPRPWYRPRTVLIVPCKGRDVAFEKNITSFFNQDYDNYLLWFVVAEDSDPAYGQLCRLTDNLAETSKALDVRILIAGTGRSCSQKIHNLLYCYEQIDDDVEIMAFADSDVCVRSDWLSHIVYPLRKPEVGAASGYRWFIPQHNNLATLALSAVNAKIAQLLGNTRFNQAWGGSMAIRIDVFRQIGLDKIWPKALSDDLSLTQTVKKAGKRMIFIPACMVASYESTTWPKLFEFGRRQFLITRVCAPGTWWFGLFSSLYSILGVWAAAAMAIYAATIDHQNLQLFAAVPILFFIGQLTRALLRQRMISKLLKDNWPELKTACAIDVLFSWVLSLLLLSFIVSSAFGRTITWRGIRYKLLGLTETIIIDQEEKL